MSQIEPISPTQNLFPATDVQTRFWYLEQMNSGSASNTVAVQWELRGHIEEAALRHSFDAIIERHEILRTSFVEIDGVVHQRVNDQSDFNLSIIDVRGLPEGERARRIEEIAKSSAREPFDLTVPNLMRVTCVQADTGRAVLLLAVHHAVFDGALDPRPW